jgi:putative membrane protein
LICIKATFRPPPILKMHSGWEEDAMWWSNYWPMPWMFIGPVAMLAFLAVCMTVMFLMMRGMGHRQRDPIDILKERFARGEIDRAQYEEQRRLLNT